MEKLLEELKTITGIEKFSYLDTPDSEYWAWVSEKDSEGVYVTVDRNGMISLCCAGNEKEFDKVYLYVKDIEDFHKDYLATRCIIKIERFPEDMLQHKISSATELISWVEENDLLLNLFPDEAESIMDTFADCDYQLYQFDTMLFRVKEDVASKICIDDVIDLAAERNYEAICDVEEKLSLSNNNENVSLDDCSEKLDLFHEYLLLKSRKNNLISAYSKTIYNKRAVYHDYTTVDKRRSFGKR